MIALGGKKKKTQSGLIQSHWICHQDYYLQDKELRIKETADTDVVCPVLQLEKHNVSRVEQLWFQQGQTRNIWSNQNQDKNTIKCQGKVGSNQDWEESKVVVWC